MKYHWFFQEIGFGLRRFDLEHFRVSMTWYKFQDRLHALLIIQP
jgi:hypothetical protein